MKKTIFILLICILMSSLVLAQGETGIENSEKEAKMGVNNSKIRAESGMLEMQNGKQIQLQVQNQITKLTSGNSEAMTSMNMTQEQTQEGAKLQVRLSNGENSNVKIMPDVASENALERLRLKVCSSENNCTIELKEVGSGEQIKAAYELKVEKKAKMFGLFNTKMPVQAQVDAETGEVIQTKKPWWAFLASESQE